MLRLDAKDVIVDPNSNHSFNLNDLLFTDDTAPLPCIPDDITPTDIIWEDCRQHKGKHDQKHEDLARIGGSYLIRAKLLFGDYARIDCDRVVDTKASIEELAATVTRDSWRTSKVFKEASDRGFSYIVLVENDLGITRTEDILTKWKNPLCGPKYCEWYKAYLCNPATATKGTCKCFKSKPVTAADVVRAIRRIEGTTNVFFKYCTPDQTAGLIKFYLKF